MRVVIVDDNASFREAASTLLEREGVTVAGVASTVDEGLRKSEEVRPDAVLIDVMLGCESGLELARRLADGDAAVILISTHSAADLADLIDHTPSAGFVSKADLSGAAVRALLSAHRET